MKRILLICSLVVVGLFFALGGLEAINPNTQSNKIFATDNNALVLAEPRITLNEFAFEKAGKVAFTNESLKGKWTLIFAGYTFCPDVCPTTLADLDRVYPSLKNDNDTTTQVVFVSVDPNRDKAEQLADYVHYFNKNFIGVTSTHQQLWPFVTQLGLIYGIVEAGDTEDFYLVDHSASIVLIDPEGKLHATFKSVPNQQGINSVDMDLMVSDIKTLQQQYILEMGEQRH
ncbi:SCO family protein [uncultured Psychromonas sp.]|uniref:SCO family protein n=1 Tax=uncultured Psychromonas sp. TaxID=173974 RepID=UPI002632FA5D|nr:SCO family protein [uncultured Psychromonas sp.]